MQTRRFLLLIIMTAFAASCVQGQQQSSKSEGTKKMLIVYYSWGGNTGEVARQNHSCRCGNHRRQRLARYMSYPIPKSA